MGLVHGGGDPTAPFPVEIAEAAIAVSVSRAGTVLLPQQRQRYAAPAQLGMNMIPVGLRLRMRRIVACRREQLAFQCRVVELDGYRPSDADHRCAPDVLCNRRSPDAQRSRDHSRTYAARVLQAQNFSYLTHRQSLGRHRSLPLCANRKGRTLPAQIAGNVPRLTLSTGWPPSIGIGGRFPSESLAALPRNPHPPGQLLPSSQPSHADVSG